MYQRIECMKVVIMAGGKGTRISSVASDIPKPMIKVEGVPVLEREIECLKDQGFDDIIMTVRLKFVREKKVKEIKENIAKDVVILCERYPALESVKEEIVEAYFLLAESYKNGGKLLVAGNGGSAADAEHIVGELMKGFKLPRKPQAEFAEKLVRENAELGTVLAKSLQGALPAIALDGHPALSTAYMNDCEPLLCFAQQVNGYGKTGDVFLGISTSGNSKNVLYAATTAHAKGMKVIGLTGAKNSKLEQMSDVCIKVPQTETYMIQELHLPVYHCLCLMLEERFFGENN